MKVVCSLTEILAVEFQFIDKIYLTLSNAFLALRNKRDSHPLIPLKNICNKLCFDELYMLLINIHIIYKI